MLILIIWIITIIINIAGLFFLSPIESILLALFTFAKTSIFTLLFCGRN